MAQFLFVEKGIPQPVESGEFSWTCANIATLIDVTASNPFVNQYDVLQSVSTYQFDAAKYPLRNSPVSLTAEDVLMFYIAIGNAHVNKPGALFADNMPAAYLDAMAFEAQSIPDLNNPEFLFQLITSPLVYSTFLK